MGITRLIDVLQDPKQNDIMSYFEESFFEESADPFDQPQDMEAPSSSPHKPQQSASFGTPSRKTPRKKLAPSPGLFSFKLILP